MKVIEALNQTSDKAVDTGEVYLRKTQEYYKLKVFKQVVSSISLFTKILIIASMLLLAVIVLVVAGILALGEYLESTVLSCLIVAGILVVFSGLAYLLRGKIESVIIQKMSKKFFD